MKESPYCRARPDRPALELVVMLTLCCGWAVETVSHADGTALAALNPKLSPLAIESQSLLYDRLIAAFEQDYAVHHKEDQSRSFGHGLAVYYLRREVQALIDMWRATGERLYLDRAGDLTLRAIDEAASAPRTLLWHEQPRGEWPCFFLETVEAETGGHNQLCDFQGSVGFMMVARCLHEIDEPAWKEIADFVEREVVEKWLYYKPSVNEWHFMGPRSLENLLAVLNSGRDIREHFACICLDLHALGYRTYPYRKWATLLVDLYLTPRCEEDQPPPHLDAVPDHIPNDWGLFPHVTEKGYIWLSVPNYDPNKLTTAMDTSHVNRTVWLATRAHDEGILDKRVVSWLANTLRFQIWAPEKGPFYFNNYIDGQDGDLNGLEPGQGGNIWFGWHRLAACDPVLEDLFLSIAYDLTNGGPNLPYGAQNKAMQNAPICLEAWGARLLVGEKARPSRFP